MPASGDRVGEYLLDAQVGRGTFGEVWRARHHVWSDRIVAVKIPTHAEYVRALQAEGTTIHGLEHPNIVRALNFDPYANPPYLAMEFVQGASLRNLISAKVLSWKDSATLMTQVLAGLGYAHDKGMVHRDIKPENILIDERVGTLGYAAPGLVKLTDFGLGKRTSALAAGSMVYTQSLGASGSDFSGTLAYMSPEQRSGQTDIDARADLYACGVMLFEMLTGERPAGTELPSELNPALPKSFDDIFRRAYARLGVRYAKADEFAGSLARLLRDAEAPPRSAAIPPPMVGIPHHPRAAATSAPLGGGPPPGADFSGWSRPAPAARKSCSKCNRLVDASDQFCMSCGTQLANTVRRCGACGAYPHPADQYCLQCGKSVAAPAAAT